MTAGFLKQHTAISTPMVSLACRVRILFSYMVLCICSASLSVRQSACSPCWQALATVSPAMIHRPSSSGAALSRWTASVCLELPMHSLTSSPRYALAGRMTLINRRGLAVQKEATFTWPYCQLHEVAMFAAYSCMHAYKDFQVITDAPKVMPTAFIHISRTPVNLALCGPAAFGRHLQSHGPVVRCAASHPGSAARGGVQALPTA